MKEDLLREMRAENHMLGLRLDLLEKRVVDMQGIIFTCILGGMKGIHTGSLLFLACREFKGGHFHISVHQRHPFQFSAVIRALFSFLEHDISVFKTIFRISLPMVLTISAFSASKTGSKTKVLWVL